MTDAADVPESSKPDRGPRPWEFDLDNLPEEFTPEIVARLTISEFEQLHEADLNSRQRVTFDRAEAEVLKPVADVGRQLAESVRLNNDALKAWAKLPALDIRWAKGAAIDPDLVRGSKVDFSSLVPKIEGPDWWKERESTIEHLQDLAQQPSRLPGRPIVGDLANLESGRLAAERERVDRERQSLEFMGQSAAAQQAMLALQSNQVEDSKTDRRLEWAVLIVSSLALIATVIALFS